MQHRLVMTRGDLVRQALPALALAAGAWVVLLVLSATGGGAVIRHDRLLVGGPPLWLATVLFVAGWQVMLLAMMVPASLHAFARLRSASELAEFGIRYLGVWTAFGLALFFFDAGVHSTVNHWPWLAAHPWLILGSTFLLAGAYQLTKLKSRCLEACRSVEHPSGLRHAIRCVGASWGLMSLAFATGAGSLAMMAALTLLMVWEVTPQGTHAVKPVGYSLIAVGVIVLAGL